MTLRKQFSVDVSGVLDHPMVRAFDDFVDRELDRIRGQKVPDRFFYALTEAANHSLLWHGVVWAKALLGFSSRRSAVELSVALGIESALVNGPIKAMFRRSRPQHEDPRPHRLRQPRTSSFPSGHATSAFVAAAMLTRNQRRGAPLVYGAAVLVASSRAYVRIHHASDVVAGSVMGIGMGAIARKLLRRFE